MTQFEENPTREKTVEYLKSLREEFLTKLAEGEKPSKVKNKMGMMILKSGFMALGIAAMTWRCTKVHFQVAHAAGESTLSTAGAAAIPGFIGIIIQGVIYAAQTGVNYRKYRKGKITKEEFKRRAKMGAFGTTCKVIGSTGGLTCGFLIGQLIIQTTSGQGWY